MNWERHFRAMKKTEYSTEYSVSFGSDADFGTVAGSHSVAELEDLLAAQQYSIDQTKDAFNSHSQELSRGDQAVYQKWIADFKALQARWEPARAKAQKVIDERRAIVNSDDWFALPSTLATAEDEYKALLKAVQQSYPELRTSPGDLVDLAGRLTRMLQAIGAPKIDFSETPQPRKDTDADLNLFKSVNTVTDSIEKAASALKPSTKMLVILGLSVGAGLLILPKLLAFTPARMILR